jgi:uncharacterized protein
MHRLVATCAALVIAILAGACARDASPMKTATPAASATATVAPVSFPESQLDFRTARGDGALRVEVASTPEQSERGLGYRDALADDAGMLFDLHRTRAQEFWMKGMHFALDFVWIGEDKRVVAVTAGVQPEPGIADAELRRYASPVPVRYVLEVSAGTAARLGIVPSTELTFDLPSQ